MSVWDGDGPTFQPVCFVWRYSEGEKALDVSSALRCDGGWREVVLSVTETRGDFVTPAHLAFRDWHLLSECFVDLDQVFSSDRIASLWAHNSCCTSTSFWRAPINRAFHRKVSLENQVEIRSLDIET